MLRYLTRSQIDTEAYDHCIRCSPQRLVYAFSWYLDVISPGWEALVEDNYAAVMPLPIRRRYGITFVEQPLFCHQLGVFAAHQPLDAAVVSCFLKALRQHIPYVASYPLSAASTLALPAGSPGVLPRTNHVLNLENPYARLAEQYRPDRRRNLKRGQQADWAFADTTDPEPLIHLFQTHNTAGIGRVAPRAYDLLRQLVRVLQARGQVRIRIASRAGRIEAGCLLVTDVNRVIHLFCAASPIGRRENARTVMLDQFIQDYAGQPMRFDFESPEVESLAAFNRSFGAVAEPYSRLTMNRLPGAIQWLQQLKRQLTKR